MKKRILFRGKTYILSDDVELTYPPDKIRLRNALYTRIGPAHSSQRIHLERKLRRLIARGRRFSAYEIAKLRHRLEQDSKFTSSDVEALIVIALAGQVIGTIGEELSDLIDDANDAGYADYPLQDLDDSSDDDNYTSGSSYGSSFDSDSSSSDYED